MIESGRLSPSASSRYFYSPKDLRWALGLTQLPIYWIPGLFACYYLVQNLLSSRLLSKNLKIRIYITIILPVVLYGCETWSLKLKEERRMRVFVNRVLRRIFGTKRDEVMGERRKLRNKEMNGLYSSPNIVRVINSRRLR
jgi:hypothetical protein